MSDSSAIFCVMTYYNDKLLFFFILNKYQLFFFKYAKLVNFFEDFASKRGFYFYFLISDFSGIFYMIPPPNNKILLKSFLENINFLKKIKGKTAKL